MAKQKRLTRLQVMLSEDELTALDNFRFEKRMPSRAAAIREILRAGAKANRAKGNGGQTCSADLDGDGAIASARRPGLPR